MQDISTILKNGSKTKIKTIDYSTPEKVKQLRKLKEKSETALRNKYVNVARLSRLFIKR